MLVFERPEEYETHTGYLTSPISIAEHLGCSGSANAVEAEIAPSSDELVFNFCS